MTQDETQVSIETLAGLIASCAYVAWTNTLVGNQCPASKHYFQRMHTPEPGDLVVEITNWKANPLDRIGRLVSADLEPPPHMSEAEYKPEDWDGKPWPPYTEKVHRIVTLDGRNYYWTNADFVVIPESPFENPGRLDVFAQQKG